jgi:hypothetical protein
MKETIYTPDGLVECDVLSINGDASMLVKIGNGMYEATYVFSDLAYGPHWQLDRQSTTEELVTLYSDPDFTLNDGLAYLNDWKNYVIKYAESERGQALGIFLLIVLVAVVAIGAISLLSGNHSMLDLYNGVGSFFQALG